MALSTSTAKRSRAEINRENAKRSTGPKSSQGKQRSRMNALRHGVTRQVLLMPEEDLKAYLAFEQSFIDHLKPEGPIERQEVKFMADAAWKINASTTWQQTLLTQRAFPEMERSHQRPEVAAAVAIANVVSRMTRELCNLSLYESRLHRQYQRSMDRLTELQQARKAQEKQARPAVSPAHNSNKNESSSSRSGFDFSTTENAPDARASHPAPAKNVKPVAQASTPAGGASGLLFGPPPLVSP